MLIKFSNSPNLQKQNKYPKKEPGFGANSYKQNHTNPIAPKITENIHFKGMNIPKINGVAIAFERRMQILRSIKEYPNKVLKELKTAYEEALKKK